MGEVVDVRSQVARLPLPLYKPAFPGTGMPGASESVGNVPKLCGRCRVSGNSVFDMPVMYTGTCRRGTLFAPEAGWRVSSNTARRAQDGRPPPISVMVADGTLVLGDGASIEPGREGTTPVPHVGRAILYPRGLAP